MRLLKHIPVAIKAVELLDDGPIVLLCSKCTGQIIQLIDKSTNR